MFRWYVVNTYSGHENKVKHNLEHRVVSLGQQRAVRNVVVPTEAVSEMKDNQKVTVEKRTMPGYVLVNMELNEDSWGVVKGTPGVTGFVGASQEPVPLTPGRGRPAAPQGGRDRDPHARAVLDRRVRQGRLGSAVGLLRRDLGDQRGRRPAQGAGIDLRSRDPGGGWLRPGQKALSATMTGASLRPRSLAVQSTASLPASLARLVLDALSLVSRTKLLDPLNFVNPTKLRNSKWPRRF